MFAVSARRDQSRAFMAVLFMLVLMASLGAFAPTVRASAIIRVTTTAQGVNSDAECSLQEAIYAANLDASQAPNPANPGTNLTTGCTAGSGADTIEMFAFNLVAQTYTMSAPEDDYANYTGPTATPMVTSQILIEGLGAKIVHYGGVKPFRAFAVGEGGSLTLREVHIRGFEVQGGDGKVGGGGGMGAGGAVYAHKGTLNVDKSTFEQNGALGGNGSTGSDVVGGGGGGLGGDGGHPFIASFAGGGGGGGARGNGGTGDRYLLGGPGGGGGGTVTDGGGGNDDLDTGTLGPGGQACGGEGGESDIGGGGETGSDGSCRGGGGGGGESYKQTFGIFGGGFGGNGHYGGGGGGGGYSDGGGGNGGFGGGGGGGASQGAVLFENGGSGNFGGGGGAGDAPIGAEPGGAGGTFAGDGGLEHGGGGAGLGGAIFGHEAAISVVNSTFVNNYANRGHTGGDTANDGRGGGGALFLVAGLLSVNNSTFSNNQTGEFTTGVGGLGGGAIVVYKPTTGLATSLVLRNSILAGNGPHECYLRNGPSASGVGNLITANTVNSIGAGVCPGVVETLDPGLEGLALNPDGRTPTMKIPLGSSAIDKADSATSEGVDQRLVLRPQGGGFDIGAYEARDLPPTTTITLAPAAPDGSNGWYRTGVGVTIAATDPDGNLAQTRCVVDPASAPAAFSDLPDEACAVTSVPGDGEHAIYAASTDSNGNTETPVVSAVFKKDGTAPTLAPTLSSTVVVVGQTGVTAAHNASDATSGVASASCGSVDTSTPGVHMVTCQATDNAGNSASSTLTYVVEYRILGFFSPAPQSRWKVGQTVPIKIALGDAADVRIPDAEATALARACRVTFSATGAQTRTAQCLKYDPDFDQFIYNWKLGKTGTGMATIRVSISYPGTTHQTTLSEQIMITK